MSYAPDPRVESARARTMREVVDMLPLADLRELGDELTGPCPRPGCGGDDRFSINVDKGVWRCRICDPKGGDPISLVQLVDGCDFMGAVTFLEGERGIEIDPQELERRRVAKLRADEKAAADSARYRGYARNAAIEIWKSADDFRGTLAEAYLARRIPGIENLPLKFSCFRYLPDHPYVKKIAKKNHELHRGPCLISAVQGADDRLSAVHQTWIDLSDPSGKAAIFCPEGKPLKSKLVRGSKKGGAIRLTGRACAPSLVMGEGIETTATALVAGAVAGASYWAGVDLPNMGGKQEGKNTGVPLLSDVEAFVPPRACARLIFIQDGDSAEIPTRATLTSGLRRALHFNPSLRAQIVRAGAGVDLNDLIKDD